MTEPILFRSPFQARDLAVPLATAIMFRPDADAAEARRIAMVEDVIERAGA